MLLSIEQIDTAYERDEDSGIYRGLVHGDPDGGFLFTWHRTLAETLSSVAECPHFGPGGLNRAEVVDFLRVALPLTRWGKQKWA